MCLLIFCAVRSLASLASLSRGRSRYVLRTPSTAEWKLRQRQLATQSETDREARVKICASRKCRVRNKNKTIELNFILILPVLVYLWHASNACTHSWFSTFCLRIYARLLLPRTYEFVRIHNKKKMNEEETRSNWQRQMEISKMHEIFSLTSFPFSSGILLPRRHFLAGKNANYSMNINLMYEQTMKSERQNNKKMKRSSEREKNEIEMNNMLSGYSNLSQRNHLTLRYCASDSLFFYSLDFHFFEFFRRAKETIWPMRRMLKERCCVLDVFKMFVRVFLIMFRWHLHSKSTSERFGPKIGTRAICMRTRRSRC